MSVPNAFKFFSRHVPSGSLAPYARGRAFSPRAPHRRVSPAARLARVSRATRETRAVDARETLVCVVARILCVSRASSCARTVGRSALASLRADPCARPNAPLDDARTCPTVGHRRDTGAGNLPRAIEASAPPRRRCRRGWGRGRRRMDRRGIRRRIGDAGRRARPEEGFRSADTRTGTRRTRRRAGWVDKRRWRDEDRACLTTRGEATIAARRRRRRLRAWRRPDRWDCLQCRRWDA